MEKRKCFWAVVALFGAACGAAFGAAAEDAPAAVPVGAMARMPVKEITVFKDGHALVLHEGAMPTDAAGNVVMDYLPTPVMGTFWPYSADTKAKLVSVVAGQRRVLVDRTAMSLRELIEANLGAEAVIRENTGATYLATIVDVLNRGSRELEATSPPNTTGILPQKGQIVLLKIDGGTKVLPIDRIADIIFKDPPRTKAANEEFRNLLTLRLDWGKETPARTVAAGLMYLQKGVRWIPHYKIDIDGEGKAKVTLQATLLNEMTDLNGVTAHLVIGVPTFAFKETLDPMALQQTVAGLSQYFQENAQTAYALSNAMMTQHARMGDYRAAPPAPAAADLGPAMPEGGKSEDLFVFTVKGISLRKGERMVVPVAEYTLDYKDVYTLDIPLAPSVEMRRQFNDSQQLELARLFHAPKVMHKIRLTNKGKYPLTTAPALIVQNSRALGQGMMTYTAIGGVVDLPITAAIDVQVAKADQVTKQTPKAAKWEGNSYIKFDVSGKVAVTNHLGKAVDLEVTRNVLGNLDAAGQDGKIVQESVFDQWCEQPYWWGWYSWPGWWRHFNGIGRVTWKFTLEPGKTADLDCSWHYFWR